VRTFRNPGVTACERLRDQMRFTRGEQIRPRSPANAGRFGQRRTRRVVVSLDEVLSQAQERVRATLRAGHQSRSPRRAAWAASSMVARGNAWSNAPSRPSPYWAIQVVAAQHAAHRSAPQRRPLVGQGRTTDGAAPWGSFAGSSKIVVRGALRRRATSRASGLPLQATMSGSRNAGSTRSRDAGSLGSHRSSRE